MCLTLQAFDGQNKYIISSEKTKGSNYMVTVRSAENWLCTCPHFTHKIFPKLQKKTKVSPCKHIKFVLETHYKPFGK